MLNENNYVKTFGLWSYGESDGVWFHNLCGHNAALCQLSYTLMELIIGLEPTTQWLQITCATNYAIPAFYGAAGGTWTRTSLRTHGPQPCQSTNSSTAAYLNGELKVTQPRISLRHPNPTYKSDYFQSIYLEFNLLIIAFHHMFSFANLGYHWPNDYLLQTASWSNIRDSNSWLNLGKVAFYL